MYFKDKFDHVFSSAHIGHAKPDHGFFQHILDNLAVEKDEVLFWDDNAENVQVANDFGIQSFVYEGHKPFKKQLKTIMKEKNG
jgi:putative hydrolase of the HAD superfamily